MPKSKTPCSNPKLKTADDDLVRDEDGFVVGSVEGEKALDRVTRSLSQGLENILLKPPLISGDTVALAALAPKFAHLSRPRAFRRAFKELHSIGEGETWPSELVDHYSKVCAEQGVERLSPLPTVTTAEGASTHERIEDGHSPGYKADSGKPQFSLLPLASMEGIVRVLEHGAAKYSRDGWRHVEDARRRYTDALMRHLAAYLNDPEGFDDDSGLPHVDHLATDAIFLAAFNAEARRG